MTWEYSVRQYGYHLSPYLGDVLDEAGADGWELASHDPHERQLIFKRPKGTL